MHNTVVNVEEKNWMRKLNPYKYCPKRRDEKKIWIWAQVKKIIHNSSNSSQVRTLSL